METQETATPIVLPSMGDMKPEESAKKSLTHWVVSMFRDINNQGPIELRSQLGYRDQRWTVLRRCVPYPLGNLTSYEPDRSVAANSTGFNANSEDFPKIAYVKYAESQANELGEMYGREGLRVLVPLIGMDDPELVNQIIQAVQPFEYALHEMEFEFTEGAKKRIQASNLSVGDKSKATKLAEVFLNGARLAKTKALAEYEALISSMSDKMAGQPGIANPSSAYQSHHWICQQLNKPIPERIDRTGGQSSAAIDILAKRALREETAAESMGEQLAAERERYEVLEEKVNTLLAAQEPKSSAKQQRA